MYDSIIWLINLIPIERQCLTGFQTFDCTAVIVFLSSALLLNQAVGLYESAQV